MSDNEGGEEQVVNQENENNEIEERQGDPEIKIKIKKVSEKTQRLILQEENKLVREREQREHEIRLLELEARLKLDVIELEKRKLKEQNEFEIRKLEIENQMKSESIEQQQNLELNKVKGPKMPKLNEGDDIEVFLRTFEKLATVHNWQQNTWATRLAAVLSGKAREAYARLSETDSRDYIKVKMAILKRYELTP